MGKHEMGPFEKRRRDLGVSREKLSRSACVSVSTIYNAEVRNITPRAAQRRNLAIALGVSQEKLWPSVSPEPVARLAEADRRAA